MNKGLFVVIGCTGLLFAPLGGCSAGTTEVASSSSSSGGTTVGSSSTGTSSGGSSGTGAGSAGTSSGGTSGGDTWSNWASADFFQLYCIGCHTPGGAGDPSGGLDFSGYQDVSTNAAIIRCGVAVSQDPSWNCGQYSVVAEQFPIGHGAKPTATERTRLVAWIDAGLPE